MINRRQIELVKHCSYAWVIDDDIITSGNLHLTLVYNYDGK